MPGALWELQFPEHLNLIVYISQNAMGAMHVIAQIKVAGRTGEQNMKLSSSQLLGDTTISFPSSGCWDRRETYFLTHYHQELWDSPQFESKGVGLQNFTLMEASEKSLMLWTLSSKLSHQLD